MRSGKKFYKLRAVQKSQHQHRDQKADPPEEAVDPVTAHPDEGEVKRKGQKPHGKHRENVAVLL